MIYEGKLINIKNVDTRQEPLFFGEPLSIQRYDRPKYNILSQLFTQHLGTFWRPEEISISRDIGDFRELSEHEQFIFVKNLGYQTLLDSAQSRGISHILEYCSNPELEAFAKIWEFSETLHSFSYTYIIKNVFSEPSKVFDEILEDKEIVKRATSVTKYYDDMINGFCDDDIETHKKKLYLTLVSINILEGIRFYVSFACSYCFADGLNKRMEGNAKIIKMINRDENLHLAFTQNVLKKLRTEKSEGFLNVVKECEPIVEQMFVDAAEEEKQWAQYLFENGSMIGLNADILTQYMEYLTAKRAKSIGVKVPFKEIQNPIPWIKNWTDSKHIQQAPQETEKIEYTIGAYNSNVDKKKLDIDL